MRDARDGLRPVVGTLLSLRAPVHCLCLVLCHARVIFEMKTSCIAVFAFACVTGSEMQPSPCFPALSKMVPDKDLIYVSLAGHPGGDHAEDALRLALAQESPPLSEGGSFSPQMCPDLEEVRCNPSHPLCDVWLWLSLSEQMGPTEMR